MSALKYILCEMLTIVQTVVRAVNYLLCELWCELLTTYCVSC